MIVGVFEPAEARHSIYANIVVDVTEYKVTPYAGFDLIRMKLAIENLAGHPMHDGDAGDGRSESVWFVLGGAYANYGDVSYSDVRGKGGDVSVEDCTAADRWAKISTGSTGETNLCFMVDKGFEPDALRVSFNDYYYSLTGLIPAGPSYHTYHQVIPAHSESAYCFVSWSTYCNADNIQPLIGALAPSPAPEPDPEPPAPPTHATLLHTIYQNHTGTLVMIFDHPVVASNPDRIYLIYDIDAYIENSTAMNLDDSELYTVDNKWQSAVLVFELNDALRMAVTESLREVDYLGLLIDTRGIYTAEDFTDITKRDGSQILVPDVVVVR